MTQISPKIGEKIIRPAVEIFVGIPSVVYGWVGLVVLVPLIQKVFDRSHGQSVLAAAIVLSVMIYPTITSVSADAIRTVNQKYIEGAYGLGSTRWQMIYKVLLPARCRASDRYRTRLGQSFWRSTRCFHGHREDARIPEEPA